MEISSVMIIPLNFIFFLIISLIIIFEWVAEFFESNLLYLTDTDLAQSTASQEIIREIGNGNDDSGSGYMHLFNPSSTTYVKHFIARTNVTQPSLSEDVYVAGYVNTTAAVTAVQFSMNSGNIDAGDICLYGIN